MASPYNLAGQSAIVTGSTSGIGQALAHALAGEGVNVVLNGFGDPAAIEKARAELESSAGVKVRYHGADMTKPDQIADMVAFAEKEFGRLDILVNNAGVQHVAPIEDFPIDSWNQIIAINLSSAFLTTRAAVPIMKAQKHGRIVNIASAHGLVASPFKSAYVAAKHGVVGLTKVVALETAEQGITCNAVCPGYVWTPLVEKQIAAQAAAHGLSNEDVIQKVLLAEQPNKRFATVEEIAGIVAFLCGPFSGSITGTTIAADGGWTAH